MIKECENCLKNFDISISVYALARRKKNQGAQPTSKIVKHLTRTPIYARPSISHTHFTICLRHVSVRCLDNLRHL